MSDSCNPMDCSPPGSSVHEYFQARILEWTAISFSRGSSWPRNWTQVFCIAGRFFTDWAMREAQSMYRPIIIQKSICWQVQQLEHHLASWLAGSSTSLACEVYLSLLTSLGLFFCDHLILFWRVLALDGGAQASQVHGWKNQPSSKKEGWAGW